MLELIIKGKSQFDDFRGFNSRFNNAVDKYGMALMLLIQAQTVKNIDKTFGNNSAGKPWDVGHRKQRGGVKLRQEAARANIVKRDRSWHFNLGSDMVPYAAIHEFGGVITPKKSKWLAIPLQNIASGKSPMEFDNLVFVPSKNNINTAFLIDAEAANASRDELALFMLRKFVTMPARPYAEPAHNDIINSQSITDIEWERATSKLFGE
jgi:phage gpG-like protein